MPSSHYAILTNRLDLSFLDLRFPYTLFLPQRRTEELLAAHLAELDVPVLRAHTVSCGKWPEPFAPPLAEWLGDPLTSR